MAVAPSLVRVARCEAAPGLAKSLEQALERALELGEVGVQVAAYVGEELVVDVWAGHATRSQDQLVDGKTLFSIFSVTKALSATAVHVQAERGLLDVELCADRRRSPVRRARAGTPPDRGGPPSKISRLLPRRDRQSRESDRPLVAVASA